MKKTFYIFLMVASLFFVSCNTNKVVVEAPAGQQIQLTSQESGCKLHDSKIVFYWLGMGTKSTSDITKGVTAPIRIETKNTFKSVMIGIFPSIIGFSTKEIQVYECK